MTNHLVHLKELLPALKQEKIVSAKIVTSECVVDNKTVHSCNLFPYYAQ